MTSGAPNGSFNAIDVSPFVVIVARSERDAQIEDLAPAVRGWAGEGTDCTSSWEQDAKGLKVSSPNGKPRWLPTYAWKGKSRWACVVREAPTEHHIYAGMCCVDGNCPHSQSVAERSAELVSRLSKVRVRRDDALIRFEAAAELHVRGGQTGRTLRRARSFWEVLREPETLTEAVPIVGAAFAVGLTVSPAQHSWGLREYGTIFVVTIVMFGALAGLRWAGQRSTVTWEAAGWPT